MNYLVVDVREPNEFAGGNVAGAINLPLSSLVKSDPESLGLPKDAKIIVYCNSGNRSGIAKKILQNFGYKDVINGLSKENVEANLNT